MAHPVFISYSSIDAAMADRICTALESAGTPCWIAPRDIAPGADYPASIVDALAAANVVVLLLTEHAIASPHILTEIGHAFSDKKRIIPFRVSSIPLSKDLDYFLSMSQWLDAHDGCTDENLKRLVAAVQPAAAGEVHVEPAPLDLPNRNALRITLVALALLGLGIVAYWKWPRSAPPKVLVTDSTKKSTSDVNGTAKIDGSSTTNVSAKTETSLSPAKTWINPVDTETYVWIPAGTFTMGCSPGDSQCSEDEMPAHPVDIAKGFWLDRTETAIAAYRKYAALHKIAVSQAVSRGDANLPATGVTWAGAKSYCAAVGGRLPAEAEWEYAARGGKPGAYYGPVPAIAWYDANSNGAPHAVGGKTPNAYGLYDMLGNVSEWVLDRYYNKYDLDSAATGAKIDLPLAPNAIAVARGGFWDGDAAAIRVSHRGQYEPDDAEPIVGFRCANDHI